MKNTTEISSDGINVYVTSSIRAAAAGKIILTVMNLLVLTAYIFFLASIKEEEIGQLFVPVILPPIFRR